MSSERQQAGNAMVFAYASEQSDDICFCEGCIMWVAETDLSWQSDSYLASKGSMKS